VLSACLSNGLCWDVFFNHPTRVSCTDRAWRSTSNCPKFCTTTSTNGFGDLRQCTGQNDQWVCGQNTLSCDNSFGVPPGYISDERSFAANAILHAATCSGELPNGTDVSGASESGTLFCGIDGSASGPSAMTVGIAVGVGVGVPLLLALATSLFFLRRALANARSATSMSPISSSGGSGRSLRDGTTSNEQHSPIQVHEVAGDMSQRFHGYHHEPPVIVEADNTESSSATLTSKSSSKTAGIRLWGNG
jgi:hypothetical protein